MLIISKFRDYYDASVGFGVDKSIVYEREKKVIKSTEFSLDEYIADDYIYPGELVKGTKILLHEWRIIGFCGRTYVLLIEKPKEDKKEIDVEPIEYFYGEDALKRVFHNRKEVRIFNGKTEKWRYTETKEFINKWHNRDFFDFFVSNKVPIFSVKPLNGSRGHKVDVILNPSLEEYKFFRIFDSYAAFQEIQMFISGVIGTGSPKTLEISNKEKIKQYGYDPQWSFRNPDPPKRKQK